MSNHSGLKLEVFRYQFQRLQDHNTKPRLAIKGPRTSTKDIDNYNFLVPVINILNLMKMQARENQIDVEEEDTKRQSTEIQSLQMVNYDSAATSVPLAEFFSWSPSSWLRLPFSLMS